MKHLKRILRGLCGLLGVAILFAIIPAGLYLLFKYPWYVCPIIFIVCCYVIGTDMEIDAKAYEEYKALSYPSDEGTPPPEEIDE